MNRKGKTNFSLGGLFFELAEDDDSKIVEQIKGTEEEIKNQKWQNAIVSSFALENFMDDETV
jgi:hypothetical protein